MTWRGSDCVIGDEGRGAVTGLLETEGCQLLTEPWYNLDMSTTSYLDRFLDPITEALTPEVARRIADLRANDELQAEIDVLREKANAGALNPDEEAVYKDFAEAVDLISIVQSKARRFLARCSS